MRKERYKYMQIGKTCGFYSIGCCLDELYGLDDPLGFISIMVENYFLQSLASVLTGTIQDSENRLARMDFKIAVELSKLSQVIAYTHDVDEESLNRLHAKCVDEVRRINGTVKFEDAYHYQKRDV